MKLQLAMLGIHHLLFALIFWDISLSTSAISENIRENTAGRDKQLLSLETASSDDHFNKYYCV